MRLACGLGAQAGGSRYTYRRSNKLRFICSDEIKLYVDIEAKPRPFAFDLGHSLFEKLTIQIETDCNDMAALSVAQNASGAATLQVAHGDSKTRAKRAVLFDGADPFARCAHCHHFALKQQVSVRLVVRAPDPPTQLIQVGEAKLVSPIDDDRICIWDVEAAFDDRRANAHVHFPANESRHDAFQFVGIHLAVPDLNSGRWTKIDNPVTHPLDGRYAIVQEKYLALAFQFAINRSANEPVVVSGHYCFDGKTVQRRRLDGGHVFYADERKIKSSRNRCGRQRQYIDQLKKLFEFFLVQHAETLLLVDYHKAEIFEYNVPRNKPMRANDNIDAAFAQ